MNIILFGGCNWYGRELIHKLLEKKEQFHITWVDNLCSEYSSRHITFKFEYLKEDCFDFVYGDVKDYFFLKSIIKKNSIIIYNIWSQPNAISGLTHICNIIKEVPILKLIYTTNKSLNIDFNCLIKKKEIQNIIGIIYDGEIIGDFDIYNKRDKIETLEYYKNIKNNIFIENNFKYFNMSDVSSFLYFLLKNDFNHELIIEQPNKIFV